MNISERYLANLTEFQKALQGYVEVLKLDLSKYSLVEADAIRNGCLQKFEYCTELCWKLGKVLLEYRSGSMVTQPKEVYRQLFAAAYISEALCTTLIDTINDRNSMSHVYKEEMYEGVMARLPKHAETFVEVMKVYNSV